MRTLSLFLATIALAGCAKTKSDNVKTTGLYVEYSATASESHTVIDTSVTFKVGGPTGTYVELGNSDKIYANGQEMDRTNLLNMISYHKTLPWGLHTTVEFLLRRDGEPDKVAKVTLPDPVDISNPLNGTNVHIGDPVPVNWNRSTGKIEVTLDKNRDGDTQFTATQDPDIGTLTIAGTQTATKANGTTLLRVRRIIAGEFPSGFTGGHIEGYEQDSITLVFIP